MFERNHLVHAVIWPKGKKASLALLDTDGVVQSEMPVTAPLKGSELAKLMPQGYCLDIDDCFAVNLSGDILVRTVGQFDTVVVTERAQITADERLDRLERLEHRRQVAEIKRQEQHLKVMKELEAEKERLIDPGGEPEVKPEEQLEEKPKKEGEVNET